MNTLLFVAFIAISVAFAWRLGKWHGALMSALRERHPQTWRELGSPHSAWADWTFTTLSFLFQRSGHLGDPYFSAQARRFCAGFLLWISVGIAWVFAFRWL